MSILQESNHMPPITATRNDCPPFIVVTMLLPEDPLQTVVNLYSCAGWVQYPKSADAPGSLEM